MDDIQDLFGRHPGPIWTTSRTYLYDIQDVLGRHPMAAEGIAAEGRGPRPKTDAAKGRAPTPPRLTDLHKIADRVRQPKIVDRTPPSPAAKAKGG